MRFKLYTEKTVAQCMVALNERIHASSKLDGWTEKSGGFALATTCKVVRRFTRRTQLEGRVERENGVTVIKGYVSEGVGPRERYIIYAALIGGGGLLVLSGSLLPALIAFAAPVGLHIPLSGDYENAQTLLHEVQRTLKAKASPLNPPPRRGSAGKPSSKQAR